jgi:hypothetical protein
MEAKNTCSICLESIESASKNHVATKCGHLFHFSCLKPCITKCPMCRTPLRDDEPPTRESNLPSQVNHMMYEQTPPVRHQMMPEAYGDPNIITNRRQIIFCSSCKRAHLAPLCQVYNMVWCGIRNKYYLEE